MNVIFSILMVVCITSLIFTNPNAVLSAMLTGGEKALSLTLKMVVVYAVWLGITEVLEKTGLSKKLARLLKPLNNRLYGKLPERANDFISLNMTANFLGMSGATTPMGIKAIEELERHPNTEYAITMFFVINATSIQLIPSSVMTLRTSLNSISPADIILPTAIATALSSIIGVLLVKMFIKRKDNV